MQENISQACKTIKTAELAQDVAEMGCRNVKLAPVQNQYR
jgi:hypothetical protein